jgi:nitrogenase molybdenum-cofactor synthesis protein NifE
MLEIIETLEERKASICCNSKDGKKGKMKCDMDSVEGSVSQRACVYCGARVVLNPITDAYHIVHGPIGCAAYTWDIRGSLSSDEEIYRNSFSTDLREKDVIFGGANKLAAAIDEIVQKHNPKLIFVYSTCVVGVIGDDIEAVTRNAREKYNIQIIPVYSTGFAGNKSAGYKAACNALLRLMDSGTNNIISSEKRDNEGFLVNYLGDFNLAAEIWILTGYLKKIGIDVAAKITGDSTYEEILKAPTAELNVVQCAGSMIYLAKEMQEKYNIPFIKISFFGIEDTAYSIMDIARASGREDVVQKAKVFISEEINKVKNHLDYYRSKLEGKKAAIYVGGAFKAISLIKQFNELGIKTVVVGTQTGKADDYEKIKEISDEGTIILDDTNPAELERFMREKGADILVGGVKERPLAYKMGIAFCDHNHERKHPLCGFEGALNFAQEINLTINSPVWRIIKKERGE